MKQTLQVKTIRNNGYFEEPLGQIKMLDHYHSFLFFINTSKLEIVYASLSINSIALQKESNVDKLTHKIYLQLVRNIKQIQQLLDKIHFNRSKRGLANFLGRTIKYITGNLSDEDLKMINNNLEILHKNQESGIVKIEKLTSFANHLSKRYAEDNMILNENIRNTQKILQNLTNTADMRILIQNEVFQSECLLNTLMMIERTISFSLNNIPNLELIKVDELLAMHKFLENVYDQKQLLPLDNVHLFKILEATKLFIIGSNQTITFLLKVPILKPYTANYSRIYPTPSYQDVLLIPSKKYLININNENYWSDENCQMMDSMKLCLQSPIQQNCSLFYCKNQ